jgi:tRNA threonylcarbamoyladenosine modification (KEOPS) complex  Pcc1 subunit
LEAEISLEYPTLQFARSIMKALSPDNKLTGHEMRVLARVRGRRLNIAIKDCERIETLQSTVQDVFRCIHAAESSLSKTVSNL